MRINSLRPGMSLNLRSVSSAVGLRFVKVFLSLSESMRSLDCFVIDGWGLLSLDLSMAGLLSFKVRPSPPIKSDIRELFIYLLEGLCYDEMEM